MISIDDFIDNFKDGFDDDALEKAFMEGNCYHFALILYSLFDGEIVYDCINGHFMFQKRNAKPCEYYDIKGWGKVYMDDGIIEWNTIKKKEPTMAKNILYNCIYLDAEGWEKLNEDK